jgi:hypothetical protein
MLGSPGGTDSWSAASVMVDTSDPTSTTAMSRERLPEARDLDLQCSAKPR